MIRVNRKQSYVLINEETKKVIKHLRKLQYFRLKQSARIEKNRLQKELGIKIEIKKIKITSPSGGRPKKDEALEIS